MGEGVGVGVWSGWRSGRLAVAPEVRVGVVRPLLHGAEQGAARVSFGRRGTTGPHGSARPWPSSETGAPPNPRKTTPRLIDHLRGNTFDPRAHQRHAWRHAGF